MGGWGMNLKWIDNKAHKKVITLKKIVVWQIVEQIDKEFIGIAKVLKITF